MLNKRNCLICLLLGYYSSAVHAKTDIELSLSAAQVSFSVKEKGGGPTFKDNSKLINFGVGAYRKVTDESAWGVVVEYAKPLDRENELPGNGTILALRPVNWRYQWNHNTSSELFFGAAKYDWQKAAIGYYAGAELSYSPRKSHLYLGVQLKYFHDLTYDTSQDDLFVNGSSFGVKVGYKF